MGGQSQARNIFQPLETREVLVMFLSFWLVAFNSVLETALNLAENTPPFACASSINCLYRDKLSHTSREKYEIKGVA